ncbi:MAG: hypothetical protein SWE60_03260 [Thermodesulfobacteriota bacterium]|nr:hypothetical protein [Thermodesulfobacteriota bacterium]
MGNMSFSKIELRAEDKWSVVDLYRFFHALNILYNRLYVFKRYYQDGFQQTTKCLWTSLYLVERGDELTIDRLRMRSPAEFNLRGAGGIIKEVRELIKDIKYRNRIEEDTLLTELMRRKVSLMKEAGYTEDETREVIAIFLPPVRKMKKQMDKHDVSLISHEGPKEKARETTKLTHR